MADLRRAPPLYAELPLPAILRFKSNRGELLYDLLSLPDPISAGIRHHRLRSAAAPPRNAQPAARTRRRTSLGAAPRRCREP